MKITNLATFLVAPRWPFLRIDTDEGIAGWGEPIVEGRAETVRAEIGDALVGADPLRIEDHWQRQAWASTTTRATNCWTT